MILKPEKLAMWTTAFSTLSLFLGLSVAHTASAYGGGGFPPGMPTYNFELVCTQKIIDLPFNRTITIPQCTLKKDDTFKQRLRDFIDRVIRGDNR